MKIEISKLTNQDKVERKMPKVKFSNFSNMKIAINETQPLDEVVRELESKGFEVDTMCVRSVNFVFTEGLNAYCFHTDLNKSLKLTTLAELKEMK